MWVVKVKEKFQGVIHGIIVLTVKERASLKFSGLKN